MIEKTLEAPAENSISSIFPATMDADLGLFNQLLQMVDGEWSDSIQGICEHVLQRFKALGVVLSILDKRFDEFIYISDSINNDILKELVQDNVPLNNDTAVERMHRLYNGIDNFLKKTVFTETELEDLAAVYFSGDRKKGHEVIEKTRLKSIVAIPALEENSNYKCFFHIGTDRCLTDKELQYINKYSNQVNVALEIVFLVRDLYIKATHDSLTRLFNHKQGEILLRKEMDRVERSSQPLTIAMIDLDYFKKVNDTFGHQAGDRVLSTVGSILTEKLRKCDIISRYGGEEFLVILPDTGIEPAVAVMKRVKAGIEEHEFVFDNKKHPVTASFGLASFNPDIHFTESLFIVEADSHLYDAKKHGRNKLEF